MIATTVKPAALQLSAMFTGKSLIAGFDAACAKQAAIGKFYEPVLSMLGTAYGLTIPNGTTAGLKALNLQLFKHEAAPKLTTGTGSRLGAIALTQYLHAYALAVVSGVNPATLAKAAPGAYDVAPLPAWADPLILAAAAKEAEEKRLQKKAAKEAEASLQAAKDKAYADSLQSMAIDASVAAMTEAREYGADIETAKQIGIEAGQKAAKQAAESASVEAAIAAPMRDMAKDAAAAWAAFAPFLDMGVITVAQRDAWSEALATAKTVEPAPKKARNTRTPKPVTA